jgi:hypothetical protein
LEDDLSGNPHADHGAEVAVEVGAERGYAAEPEQCYSGSPSSASGARRIAPGLVVAASAAADQYPGCSAPAGQNRYRCAWCSPSDCNKQNFMRTRYCAAAEMKLRKDMTERKEYRFYPQRSNSIFYYLVQVGLGSICMNKFNLLDYALNQKSKSNICTITNIQCSQLSRVYHTTRLTHSF